MTGSGNHGSRRLVSAIGILCWTVAACSGAGNAASGSASPVRVAVGIAATVVNESSMDVSVRLYPFDVEVGKAMVDLQASCRIVKGGETAGFSAATLSSRQYVLVLSAGSCEALPSNPLYATTSSGDIYSVEYAAGAAVDMGTLVFNGSTLRLTGAGPSATGAARPSGTNDPELAGLIQAAITASDPTVTVGGRSLPFVGLGNGAKVTIGGASIKMGRCVFVSRLSSPLRVQGAPDGTEYLGGEGAVICDGKDVYLYGVVFAFALGSASPSSAEISPLVGLSDIKSISAGFHCVLALENDGTVVEWPQCGLNKDPVVESLSEVVAISAGQDHNLALKTDGSVVGWGIGDAADVPKGLSGVAAISAGAQHSLALKRNGTVVAWGLNQSGETTVPTGLSSVVAISAGYDHGLALKKNGTVVAWGGAAGASVPAGLSGVVAISAGFRHSLALKADGTVVAWGKNDSGQANVPKGLSGVVAISAGWWYSLALKNDGTVVAWGGEGAAYSPKNLPLGLSDVAAISAGSDYGLAMRGDGTVVCWGESQYAADACAAMALRG